MPQLDIFVFFLEVLYNSFSLLVFYLVVLFLITPRLFVVLRYRSRLLFWLHLQKKLSFLLFTNFSFFLYFTFSKFYLALIEPVIDVTNFALNNNIVSSSYFVGDSFSFSSIKLFVFL
jgi:hypothetical protein